MHSLVFNWHLLITQGSASTISPPPPPPPQLAWGDDRYGRSGTMTKQHPPQQPAQLV